MIRSIITGTGCYIPSVVVPNRAFENNQFFETDGSRISKGNETIIEKFQSVTGIYERRYAGTEQKASDLGFLAATAALNDSGIDKETLDYIIVAHNFGDVAAQSNRVTLVPSMATKVKSLLGIQNPDCVAYDIAFGCPGWIEAIIQANYFINSGDARRCLIIGTETLSRVIDEHDRDSMIYSDGSGAVIMEAFPTGTGGILAHKTRTYANGHAYFLTMDKSYSPLSQRREDLFLKMSGRKVYEFALSHVPELIKAVLDKAGLSIGDIDKVLIHQANEKMDEAILSRLFKLYDIDEIPAGIMPMTIGSLGNSSVATIPTLLDLIRKGNLQGHALREGDKVVMASVGAGMNINAVVYQF